MSATKTFLSLAVIIGAFAGGYITKTILTKDITTSGSVATTASPVTAPIPSACDFRGVTFFEFKDVVKRYGDERWKVINNQMRIQNSDPDFEDARSVWFRLTDLKSFLCSIEQNSAKIGLLPDVLGVKMYYSVYDGSHGAYAGRHTIFMTAAYEKTDMEKVDFDPRLSRQKGSVVTLLDIANSNIDVPIGILGLLQTPEQRPAKNSGDLCPPPGGCNAALFNYIDNQ